MEMTTTTTPMSNEEIVENLKTMTFGKQAYERFNAKERETLDRAWNIIDQYENRLKADMVAMLTEIREKAWYHHSRFDDDKDFEVDRAVENIVNYIDAKINSLKE